MLVEELLASVAGLVLFALLAARFGHGSHGMCGDRTDPTLEPFR